MKKGIMKLKKEFLSVLKLHMYMIKMIFNPMHTGIENQPHVRQKAWVQLLKASIAKSLQSRIC